MSTGLEILNSSGRQEVVERKYVGISRRLYLCGYLGLPVLWLFHVLFFRHGIVVKLNLGSSVKQDIRKSKLALVIVSSLFLVWLIFLRIWNGGPQTIEIF
ncbi:hypothetical protein Gasu2_64650 [Galdieria sulphuraria]|uniref:Gamma-secretase subunit PEN-2 n=1 Tax=Galdieria sulphuraria TaxID=130081 RepID=M2Y5A8_GALSU|nr:uncharacterized protein Gasu_16480 [Galdieria sulphuraria]EME31153.1 hypothetical protein Gasu_16480 [Galdieria sulphuraria]GJD12377.1 hypothetical protein Gasu2_64650 [Galdieria sulphuraria]|eukprot:XP_005707673.1 hypothetical protein Gasu_16480 [Galdieria sulphuraria]